jgi:DNA-binding LytR/AlgR family response regulator
MWEIVICDADEAFVETLKEKLEAFYGNRGFAIHLTVYRDAFSFIEGIDNQPMDLIFMSTQMPKLDGYLLSEVIRSRPGKRDSILVFLGDQDKDVFGAFAYQPFDYIRKQYWEEMLPVTLKRLWRMDHRKRGVEICYQRKRRWLRVTDIICIEGQGHYLTFHCVKGETYRFRGRMADYEQLLCGYYFVHSAKSFYINCAHIKEIRSMVLMKDGTKIPCSKSCGAQTKRMWHRYMREMMRL